MNLRSSDERNRIDKRKLVMDKILEISAGVMLIVCSIFLLLFIN